MIPKRRLYWFSPHATPYHAFVFRQLASEFPGFEVVFGTTVQASHPWKAHLADGFRSRQSSTNFGIDWQSVRLPIADQNALFVVVGWNTTTNLILLVLLRLLRRDYVLWTDTPKSDRQGPVLRERARAAFLRWVFSGSRAVMGTGQSGIEGLRKLGAPEEKLVVFPFFVDLEAFRRLSWKREPGALVHFVSSGRVINPLKGHDVALRALAKASAITGQPFRYSIAGTGPDVETLRALATQLGIASSIELLGWTEPEELREIMKSADALIHPSPIQDPFPNAVLEGMAAGMVVFGSDVSGSATDRIDHGDNGFIHRAADVDELATHIAILLRDPSLATRMGPKAAARAEEWPVQRGIHVIRRLFHRS